MSEALDQFSTEDREYIETVVKAAYPEMETHVELFDLPSGKELWLYCDGTFKVKDNQRSA